MKYPWTVLLGASIALAMGPHAANAFTMGERYAPDRAPQAKAVDPEATPNGMARGNGLTFDDRDSGVFFGSSGRARNPLVPDQETYMTPRENARALQYGLQYGVSPFRPRR